MADIYGLYGDDGRLRYIGKANNPASRLNGHMRDSRKSKTPLYDWIRKHGRPEMRVLEADCADWRESERRLIAEARARGESLLNIADGGDQPFCPTHVRAENGRRNAAAIHADPKRKRFHMLKLSLSRSLKQGYGSNELRARLRLAAELFPSKFGCFSDVQDREEDQHGNPVVVKL